MYHKNSSLLTVKVRETACTQLLLNLWRWNLTCKYRMRINYRRISLRHNLSRKCRKIVKFLSITHSERNIWNGPIVATAISREKRKSCWREMADSPTERSWCVLEFVAVQCAFRRQFGRLGPPETSIRRWYEHFRYRGCICHHVLQNTPIIYTHPVF
jgi:hypothetical protein